MNIQWYPGHMTKAKRMMEEDIKLVDLVIELLDARVPMSSRNPDIDELGKNKARLVLLNKSDLADEARTNAWDRFFQEKGYFVVKLNARSGAGVNRPVRAMVVGIPNVGKSTFINTLAGKACAKTGNKPGVTKGKQWIRLNKNVELLDTPGILWPKFDDQSVGIKLALIGSIKDEILNISELSLKLIEYLKNDYKGILADRYQVNEDAGLVEILTEIAANRNCKAKGDELDLDKASKLILDEFREGKLGKITLEKPE